MGPDRASFRPVVFFSGIDVGIQRKRSIYNIRLLNTVYSDHIYTYVL
jgi:hypothetical protein